MQFKEVIYQNYVVNHTSQLYGVETLERIRLNSFPDWKYYFEKLLPSDKSAKILDIGCGNGSFVHFLNETGYKLSGGIDLSAEQISQGYSMGITNITCADLHTFLKDKTEVYDCIIARDVMEHLTRQEIFDALTVIQKSLCPGGCFIMQSPNGQGIFHTSLLYGDFTHETAFTESSLNQICKNTGFTTVSCYPTGPVPKGFISSIRYMLWQMVVLKIKFTKMIETGDSSGIFTQNMIAKAVKV